MLDGGDVKADVVTVDGAGEIVLNPTRSVKLFPCDAETGFGAAICVLGTANVDGGCSILGMEGFAAADVVGSGVADWKSSKSSSSFVVGAGAEAPSIPRSSIGFVMGFLPLYANSLGGVIGGRSPSSKLNMSFSGSFLGGSSFFRFRFAAVDDDGAEVRTAGEATAPSSYSSYSSNRSLLA